MYLRVLPDGTVFMQLFDKVSVQMRLYRESRYEPVMALGSCMQLVRWRRITGLTIRAPWRRRGASSQAEAPIGATGR